MFHCLKGTPLPYSVSLFSAGKRCAFKGGPTTTSTVPQVVEPLGVYRFVDGDVKRNVASRAQHGREDDGLLGQGSRNDVGPVDAN